MEMETYITLLDVYNICSSILNFVDDDAEIIPQELVDVITTFDSECTDIAEFEPNNDIELLMYEIHNSLQYNEDVTALSEISQRLEVIDTRLDREFIAVNDCYSFICTLLLCFVSFKFLDWLLRAFSV